MLPNIRVLRTPLNLKSKWKDELNWNKKPEKDCSPIHLKTKERKV
jgi:hypothetical protein